MIRHLIFRVKRDHKKTTTHIDELNSLIPYYSPASKTVLPEKTGLLLRSLI